MSVECSRYGVVRGWRESCDMGEVPGYRPITMDDAIDGSNEKAANSERTMARSRVRKGD